MKVVLKNQEYSVTWNYSKFSVKRANLETTECLIEKVNSKKTGKEKYGLCSSGKVKQRFGETGNRNIARKLSLHDALRRFGGKQERAAIWDAFVQECKGPWKKKNKSVLKSVEV